MAVVDGHRGAVEPRPAGVAGLGTKTAAKGLGLIPSIG
ncbi:hypothetical protein JOF48_002315 [Arthrobacter stackebrandtii]|uniref:Uncharacterized protein n=1 Tax=Arthrobacter stackebrandtii TaxID=272161 RepID=A0ABS4YXH0_9MICC|nr:hypothetical protein [Arthrobacter stackebrandtii]